MNRVKILAIAVSVAAALGVGAAYGRQAPAFDPPPRPPQQTQSPVTGGGVMMSEADMADMKQMMADMKRMMEHCNQMMAKMEAEHPTESGKPDDQ